MYLYKEFFFKKKAAIISKIKYVRRHRCITPPRSISDFLKGKAIVSVTQTHFESSTYVNELTEGAQLFFWEFTQRGRRQLRAENIT